MGFEKRKGNMVSTFAELEKERKRFEHKKEK
jgi:hypothetical protein